MTRMNKIDYLLLKGEKINYHLRKTDKRLVVDSIWAGEHWEIYGTCSNDQVKAGQLIDRMYWNWTLER